MSEQLSSLLYQVGLALLVPLGIIVTAWGKLIQQKIQLRALQIKGDRWGETQTIVQTAIMSAEKQLKLGSGSNKKDHAMKVAKKLLKNHKIKLEDDILSEMIEAQVWDTFDSPAISNPAPIPAVIKETEAESKVSPTSIQG